MIKIYTDGSFKGGIIGWAFIAIEHGTRKFQDFGTLLQFEESRQVGGECSAVLQALSECKRRGIRDVEICYDYEGVAGWAKKWKANTAVALWYKERVRKFINTMNIKWTKVKGHSGDYWNEQVDKMAGRVNFEMRNFDK